MNALTRWWKGLFSNDRRSTDRMKDPRLVVYYWTGSRPEKHEVRDISPSGIYVLTEERWYPGTIVKMTLQMTDGEGLGSEEHIAIESRAVRWGEDGVGMSFVLREHSDHVDGTSMRTADKKMLDKFLRQFWTDPAEDTGVGVRERA